MLKIMTLNVNYYGTKHGPWPVRREIIREVIQRANPDLIALQAVGSDPAVMNGLDQATQLAQLLPDYRYVLFQPAQRTPAGGAQGSAFLSRRRWETTTYLSLTRLANIKDTNKRELLVARLELASGPLYIFNGHFSWVAEQARANVSEALQYIDTFAGRGLLVGDLNNTPDSAIIQQIRRIGWTDVWTHLHPEENGFTFESNNPALRIDYAWSNGELEYFVRAIEIVAQEPNAEGARASDHLGLLVTLNLAT